MTPEQLEDKKDEIVGKRAYKLSDSMYGGVIGVVEKAEAGTITPYIIANDFMRLGAFKQDIVIVGEDESYDEQ